RFTEARQAIEQATRFGSVPRYVRELEAWSYSRMGLKTEAAKRFAELYRETPNETAAQGLLASYDNHTLVDAGLAATEPLAGLLRTEGAVAAFNAGRYIEAVALDTKRYGAVGGVSAPQAAVFASRGDKTGDEGTSRFHRNNVVSAEGGLLVA